MGMRIAAALAFTVLATAAVIAYASRNSAGTMAPANGPYVAGTVISSSVVNARFSDIEAEITDSLSRSGKGGMTAPLRTADGTVAAPAHSFTSETGSGLYRIGASDLAMSIAGVKTHEWIASGETITGTLSTSVSGSATTTLASFLEPSLANGNTVSVVLGASAASNASGALQFNPNATAALSTTCLAVFGQTSTLCVDGNAKTTAAGPLAVTGASTLTGALAANGGATIGSGGTAISASYRGTTSWTPGALAAHGCATTTITLTGAAAGAECAVGQPGQPLEVFTQCTISANTCNLMICNEETGAATGASGTYSCRAFNP